MSATPCPECGRRWRAASFCGRCGARLSDGMSVEVERGRRPWRSLVLGVAVLATAAVSVVVGSGELASMLARSGEALRAAAPTSVQGGDLGIELPDDPRDVQSPSGRGGRDAGSGAANPADPGAPAGTPSLPPDGARCANGGDACIVWQLEPEIARQPVLVDQERVLAVDGGDLVAWDVRDGRELWRATDLLGEEGPRAAVHSGQIQQVGDLVVLHRAGDLYVVTSDGGEPRWTRDGNLEEDALAWRGFELRDGSVLGVTHLRTQGPRATRVVAAVHDRGTGAVRWEATGYGIAAVGGIPIIADRDGIRALDPVSGRTEWQLPIAEPAQGTPVLAGSAMLWVGPAGVDVLDPDDGGLRRQIGGRLVAAGELPVVRGPGSDAPLIAVDPTTGTERWRFPMDAELGCCTKVVSGSEHRLLLRGGGGDSYATLDVATGALLHEARVDTDERVVDIRDDVVLTSPEGGRGLTRAIDVEDGTQRWLADGFPARAPGPDGLVVVRSSGRIAALATEY